MDRNLILEWFRSEPKKYRFSSDPFPVMKQLAIFLCGWIGFKVISFLVQLLMMALIKYDSSFITNYSYSMGVNTATYLCLIIILLLIANIDITKLLKSFKKYQSYLAAIACLLSIYAFYYVYGVFISIIKSPVTNNANEQALVVLENSFPIISFVVFGIVGPICEELTYRVGLFSLLSRKSRKLAYAVTIIIFAFIHFNFSTDVDTLVNELLNIPYYAFAAFAFSFVYERFGFSASLIAHILNNVISLMFVNVIR